MKVRQTAKSFLGSRIKPKERACTGVSWGSVLLWAVATVPVNGRSWQARFRGLIIGLTSHMPFDEGYSSIDIYI